MARRIQKWEPQSDTSGGAAIGRSGGMGDNDPVDGQNPANLFPPRMAAGVNEWQLTAKSAGSQLGLYVNVDGDRKPKYVVRSATGRLRSTDDVRDVLKCADDWWRVSGGPWRPVRNSAESIHPTLVDYQGTPTRLFGLSADGALGLYATLVDPKAKNFQYLLRREDGSVLPWTARSSKDVPTPMDPPSPGGWKLVTDRSDGTLDPGAPRRSSAADRMRGAD